MRYLDIVCTDHGQHDEELLAKLRRYDTLAERWARDEYTDDERASGFGPPYPPDPDDYVHEWFSAHANAERGAHRPFTAGVVEHSGAPGRGRTLKFRCRVCHRTREYRDETLTQYEGMTRDTPGLAGRLDVSQKF